MKNQLVKLILSKKRPPTKAEIIYYCDLLSSNQYFYMSTYPEIAY